MPHDELKPKDKVVLRMSRDGAVEENLTEGTMEKVSKRLEDAQLVTPHDAGTDDLAEEVRKRRQLRPDELESAEGQAQTETQTAETIQEYKPGELPVNDNAVPSSLHSEAYHAHHTDYGKVVADTAVTGKVSRPRSERQIDGEAVLEKQLRHQRKCRTSAAILQLPAGLSGWSANLRGRMSVWMPPVRSCPPRRC